MPDEPTAKLPQVNPDDTVDSAPATGEAAPEDPPRTPVAPEAPTEALPEATPDEPTVTLPAAATPDEPTVTLPAAATPDEPTATLPAAATPDELTVTLPAAATPDEPTVPLPAAATEGEPTVTLPARTVSDGEAATSPEEPTVALPAAAAPDEATVAMPVAAVSDGKTAAAPDGETVALPAAAPIPDSVVAGPGPSDESTVAVRPDVPSDGGAAQPTVTEPAVAAARAGFALTRRQLLIALTGVTGAAVVAGAVAARSATKEPGAAPRPSAPAVTRPRTPESAAVTARPLPVQHRPISTLAEYRAATGVAAFPADAIALTIDDGPHPVWTPKILRLLDKHHVPAVFCMIGNQVLGHEAVAQTVTRAGHQLANHTWSHPTKLAAKPGPFVEKQLLKAQTKIKNTTGYAPTLFRSPGGDWSPQLLREAAHAGLLALDWTVDPRDWSRPGVNKIEQRLLSTKPGQILLCHDGGGDRSQTYKALSVVIPALKARGLQFVALDAPKKPQP